MEEQMIAGRKRLQQLLDAADAAIDFAAIKQSVTWRCRFCGRQGWKWNTIKHAYGCPVPGLQAAIDDAQADAAEEEE